MFRSVSISALAAATLSVFTTSSFLLTPQVRADATPELRNLIDSQKDRETAEQKRLDGLRQLNREQRRLEDRLDDLSPADRQLAAELENKAREFQQAADQLVRDLENAARDSDGFSGADFENRLQPLLDQQNRLDQLGDQLGDVADRAENAGIRRFAFNGATFFTTKALIIRRGLLVSFTIIQEGDNNLKEELKERLLDQAGTIRNLQGSGAQFDNGPKQDDFKRLDDLRRAEDARRDQIRQIEGVERARRDGDNVLEALGERIRNPDQGNEGQFANNEGARQRVQELARGLAGAGARLQEIRDQLPGLQQQFDQADRELQQREAELREARFLRENRESLEQTLKDVARIRQNLVDNNEEELKNENSKDGEGIRDLLRQLDAEAERVRNVLERQKRGDIPDEKELDALEEKAKAARDAQAEKRFEILQKVLKLEKDEKAIAALQAELAFLIRNGAPLGPPKAPPRTAQLDNFINGGGSGGLFTQPVSDGSGEFNVQIRDPLSPNQFGFESTQGNTENNLGLGNGGGITGGFTGIPCPPGSNLLPVGTLVSDTSACFI